MKILAIPLLFLTIGFTPVAWSQGEPPEVQPDFQPDGTLAKLVRADPGTERVVVGGDIYNRSARGQTLRSAVSLKGRPAQYFYRVENDGAMDDAFRLRATDGGRFFRVAYFAGSRNVTGRITGRGLATGEIASGEPFSSPVRVVVKPDKRKILRSRSPRRAGRLNTSISAISRGSTSTDELKSDRVLARTIVKRR